MSQPNWLDETEKRIWLSYLEATGRVHQLLDAEVKRTAALRFEDFEVLVHLSEAHQYRLRMTELSQMLLHSQARLTQRVSRLADQGLVRRERCPEDRRGVFAVITDQGMAVVASAAPAHVASVRAHLIDLIRPEERELLAEIFERIATAARHHGGALDGQRKAIAPSS